MFSKLRVWGRRWQLRRNIKAEVAYMQRLQQLWVEMKDPVHRGAITREAADVNRRILIYAQELRRLGGRI